MKTLAQQEAETKRQIAEEEKAYRAMLLDIKEICKLKHGRRFINTLLALTEIYSDSFTGNSQTYFNEGKRSIGLQIIELLNEADPQIYLTLLKENLEQLNA